MNLVRVLRTENKVPKNFWHEAVKWMIPILNRSPTLAVNDMTPEEAWSREKPYVAPELKKKCLRSQQGKIVIIGVLDWDHNLKKRKKRGERKRRKEIRVLRLEEKIWSRTDAGDLRILDLDLHQSEERCSHESHLSISSKNVQEVKVSPRISRSRCLSRISCASGVFE